MKIEVHLSLSVSWFSRSNIGDSKMNYSIENNVPVIRLPTISVYIRNTEGESCHLQYLDAIKSIKDNSILNGDFKQVAMDISRCLIKNGYARLSELVEEWVEYCKTNISNIPFDKGKVIWTN